MSYKPTTIKKCVCVPIFFFFSCFALHVLLSFRHLCIMFRYNIILVFLFSDLFFFFFGCLVPKTSNWCLHRFVDIDEKETEEKKRSILWRQWRWRIQKDDNVKINYKRRYKPFISSVCTNNKQQQHQQLIFNNVHQKSMRREALLIEYLLLSWWKKINRK